MSLLSLTRRHAVDQAAARRELEAELTKSRSVLAKALVDYAFDRDSHSALTVMRRDYHRVSAAYRRAVTSTLALEHDRPGSMTGPLEELRRRQQRHLLHAPAGVLLPVVVQPRSNAAYGPLIPGMDFDHDDPMGAPTGREWGLDLPAALDEASSA